MSRYKNTSGRSDRSWIFYALVAVAIIGILIVGGLAADYASSTWGGGGNGPSCTDSLYSDTYTYRFTSTTVTVTFTTPTCNTATYIISNSNGNTISGTFSGAGFVAKWNYTSGMTYTLQLQTTDGGTCSCGSMTY